MVAFAGKLSGTGRALSPPAGPFTPGYREPSMYTQSTTTPADRLAKRNRLKELVAELGRDATSSQVREHAYRVGFGSVNSAMLVYVRNELWPDRPKRGSGRRGTETRLVLPPGYRDALTCPPCGSVRTASCGRWIRSDGTAMRTRVCRNCGHSWKSECSADERLSKKDSARVRALVATEKECSHCKKMLPVNHFRRKGPDFVLYRSKCSECEWHVRRVSFGKRSLRQLYGISLDDYQAQFASQQGRCAVCGKQEAGERRNRKLPLCVDHCHKTGKIRGLLCNKCNLGIGNFDDDLGRLEAVIAYLRRHQLPA